MPASPQPVVIPPPAGEARARPVPARTQESEPTGKKDQGMRNNGSGSAPVAFQVAPREVFHSLRRAVSGLGMSMSSVVSLAPVRTVCLSELIATQPTVDPAVVKQFVDHPDCARTGEAKRHADGRLLDLPLVVEVEEGDGVPGRRFIYDGHHRCQAAVARGEADICVRLIKVKRLVTLRVVHHDAVRARVLGDDGKPPDEFRIFAFGSYDTCKGKFLFDEKAAKSVMSFYEDQGNALSIDYEHMAVCDPPVIAPAAGFFKLEMRKDGLWACDVQWTKRAAGMLEDKEYRFTSPAFTIDKESKRIVKLLNIALTNIPATKDMRPIVEARLVDSTIVLCRAGVLRGSRTIEAATRLAASIRRKLVRLAAKPATYEALASIARGASKAADGAGTYKLHLLAAKAQKRAAGATTDGVSADHLAAAEKHRVAAAKLFSARSVAHRMTASRDAVPGEQVQARMTSRRRFTRGVVAGLAKGGFRIQSLIFPKAHWSKKAAKRWARDHEFASQVDEKEKSYRFRQMDPASFESVATICLTPTGASAGDGKCKIKAVGGSLKKRTAAVTTAPAEEEKLNMARKKVTASANKGNKKVTAAAPASGGRSTSMDANLFDKDGRPVSQEEILANAREAGTQTAIRKGRVQVAAKDDDKEEKVDEVEVQADSKADSGDSADSDSDSDSKADSGDSVDGDEQMAAAADSKGDSMDSADSEDSDSADSEDTEDSDSEVDEEATATPTNPPADVAASARARAKSKFGVAGRDAKSGHSIATVVATVTGTRSRKEQIAKLHALADAGEEIRKLSATVEKMEMRDRKQRIVKRVDRAIEQMRLPPAKRDKAITLGLKHGSEVLADYIDALPARGFVKRESTEPRDRDPSVKLVSASLTSEDREVMAKFGLTEDAFVQTRMARSVKERTGQGRQRS